MKWKTMSALLVAALLTGCATGGHVPSDGCAWTRPILVGRDAQSVDAFRREIDRVREDRAALDAVLASLDDVLTEATAAQLLAHNETGARICGWGVR